MTLAEEIADKIVLAAVLELPADGIIRYSTLSSAMDIDRGTYYELGATRTELWLCIIDKLRSLGFKAMTPGHLGDFRQ